MYTRLPSRVIPPKVRAVITTVTIAFVASNTANAQQTQKLSPWVLGAALGMTTKPSAAFVDGFYYASVDGPYDWRGCVPSKFMSFGVLGGRRISSWLRTDLAVAGNIESNDCYAIVYIGPFGPYARVEYLGRIPGYAHFTVIARTVLERQNKPGFRPRAVASIGCMCDKRIPLGQLGAGFSAGSLHTRFALEAGGQIAHFSWTRRITGEDFPAGRPPLLLEERGASTPGQFWLRMGVEYTPQAQR
jgi:hypothetical protein